MAAPAILSQEVDKAFGRRLTLNVTGALGAIMCELGFPAAGMRGLAPSAAQLGFWLTQSKKPAIRLRPR
jgi:hypothetical protein